MEQTEQYRRGEACGSPTAPRQYLECGARLFKDICYP